MNQQTYHINGLTARLWYRQCIFPSLALKHWYMHTISGVLQVISYFKFPINVTYLGPLFTEKTSCYSNKNPHYRLRFIMGIPIPTRTPAFWDTHHHHHMITHTSDSHQIPSQNKTKSKFFKNFKILPKIIILKFCKNFYRRHTFWSCLIRCINMKWIQPEL